MNLIGDCTRFDTMLTITFQHDGKGTLMTLRQEGFPESGDPRRFRPGLVGAGKFLRPAGEGAGRLRAGG
jgi:hypothetical protein